MDDVVAEGLRAPLRVVVAMDSFKGSVTGAEANGAVREGVLQADPHAIVASVPVADGGEGTLAAITPFGTLGVVPTVDLLGRSVSAPFVSLGDAVALESASTVGLPLLGDPTPAHARRAHSFGLGLHLRGAVAMSGRTRALLGLGGTGVTDGGIGMLIALGARVWTWSGDQLWPDGRPRPENPLLARPTHVELPALAWELVGLADVASPLLGPTGAARMFGPQKGADEALVDELETAMTGWAAALASAGAEVAEVRGSGAAGGLGAGVLAARGALRPGLPALLEETGAAEAFAEADLVITGEGALDAQTAQGKVPAAVASVARRAAEGQGRKVSVAALAGRVDVDDATLAEMGIDTATSIHGETMPVDALTREVTLDALARAAARLVGDPSPR